MTFLKRISAFLLALAVVLPAAAQFSFGPRVGINMNSVHFSEDALNDLIDTDNHTGYNLGLQAEFMLPVINLGLDASVMYVHRGGDDIKIDNLKSVDTSADYIEIPINLKYKLGLPIVGNMVAPYIFTGPSFAFRLSEAKEFYNDKKCDIAWNVGLGVQLFSHLQIGASYGFGLNDTIGGSLIPGDFGEKSADLGKQNCWTITAAWLF